MKVAVRQIDSAFSAQAAKVRSLCRFVLGSRDAAEEAVGEIYLKVVHAQARYDERRSFAVWIMAIARHHCVDLLRRRRVEERLFTTAEVDPDAFPSVSDRGPAPLAGVLARESRDALRSAIERLPRQYRLPLVLRYYEELSYDEIARELGLTRQCVGTLLFRAKQQLRAGLAGGTPTEST